MSHSLSMPQPAPFSWRRSSAISATLGFHAGVFILLLAPPVVRQIVPALKPDPITVIVKEPEPLPKPIEDLQPPPKKKKVEVKLPVKPVVEPVKTDPVVTQESTPMSTPAQTEPSGPAVDAGPAETEPTPLGYGRRHAVAYPRKSVINNEQGTVILRVLIGSDGVPQRIEIEKSSGFPALDRAAREAVMKWRFTAGTKNGVPYTAWGRVPVEFQLDKQ